MEINEYSVVYSFLFVSFVLFIYYCFILFIHIHVGSEKTPWFVIKDSKPGDTRKLWTRGVFRYPYTRRGWFVIEVIKVVIEWPEQRDN